jgi:hypothetical protein
MASLKSFKPFAGINSTSSWGTGYGHLPAIESFKPFAGINSTSSRGANPLTTRR